MVVDTNNFFHSIKQHPDRFFLIHYSSQDLFGECEDALSPRITSIVVMHFPTRQTVSFTIHAIAELLGISRDDVSSNYDKIEKELLKRFYDFIRERREKYWIHWNMRNLTFGFEHIEQRYSFLSGDTPPHIPVEVRLNLSDILKERYGSNYAPDPKMKNLMMLNGELDRRFLDGSQEAEAFKKKEFIRMHSSTICKVEFFRHIIVLAMQGRLHTTGDKLSYRVDRLLDSRLSRVVALVAASVGVIVGIWQLFLWVHV